MLDTNDSWIIVIGNDYLLTKAYFKSKVSKSRHLAFNIMIIGIS